MPARPWPYVWEPSNRGAGSSDAVAGLVGALIVGLWSARQLPRRPSYLYAAYFASYLTGMAAAGPRVGTLGGSAAAAAVMTIRRAGRPEQLRMLLTAVVVVGAVAMVALHDTHGVGLVTGLILGLLFASKRETPWAEPDIATKPDPVRP